MSWWWSLVPTILTNWRSNSAPESLLSWSISFFLSSGSDAGSATLWLVAIWRSLSLAALWSSTSICAKDLTAESVAFCAASLPISTSNWPPSAALVTNCASGAGSGVALALIVPLVPTALLLSTDGLTPAVVLLGDWLPGTVPVAESLVPAGGLVCAVVAP